MGNRVFQYFLNWVIATDPANGKAWIDHNVHTFLAVGAPFLGATKTVRGLMVGASPVCRFVCVRRGCVCVRRGSVSVCAHEPLHLSCLMCARGVLCCVWCIMYVCVCVCMLLTPH